MGGVSDVDLVFGTVSDMSQWSGPLTPNRFDKPIKVSSQVEAVRSDQSALDGFQRVF